MKWVTIWGNAQSTVVPSPQKYAKNLTLRYPIYAPFGGNRIRITLDNYTQNEEAPFTACFIGRGKKGTSESKDMVELTFHGKKSFTIKSHEAIQSDPIDYKVEKDEWLVVTLYFKEYVPLTAGVDITGPLSKGFYSYGDESMHEVFDINTSKATTWVYYLANVDLYTEDTNECIVCYGDSITSQDWPDYMMLALKDMGIDNVAVVRKAVSGTRILRQYECITYQSYGLKGKNRFMHECSSVSGASKVIIQHGINDIIHPVGEDVNIFRPMSDMPTKEDLVEGMEYYKKCADALGLTVYYGTLLPIFGWRTYEEFREVVKNDFNEYLKSKENLLNFEAEIGELIDGAWHFKDLMDSGDHLHPSKLAYKAMGELAAKIVYKA